MIDKKEEKLSRNLHFSERTKKTVKNCRNTGLGSVALNDMEARREKPKNRLTID